MQVHCHGEGEAHSMAKDIIAYFLSHSSPSLHPFPTVLGSYFCNHPNAVSHNILLRILRNRLKFFFLKEGVPIVVLQIL